MFQIQMSEVQVKDQDQVRAGRTQILTSSRNSAIQAEDGDNREEIWSQRRLRIKYYSLLPREHAMLSHYFRIELSGLSPMRH